MSYLYPLLAIAAVLLLYYIGRMLEKILDKLTRLNLALNVDGRLEMRAADAIVRNLHEGIDEYLKEQKAASATAESSASS